jgi:hypothetical protein
MLVPDAGAHTKDRLQHDEQCYGIHFEVFLLKASLAPPDKSLTTI